VPIQSYSTVTAVLRVAVDRGDLAMLTLLDPSTAFDRHSRPQDAHASSRCVVWRQRHGHRWFVSYLSGRSQFVRCRSTSSLPKAVLFGVPHLKSFIDSLLPVIATRFKVLYCHLV